MRTFQAAVLVRELAARENVIGRLLHAASRASPCAPPLWPILPRARRESGGAARALAATRSASSARQAWSADARVANVPHGVEQLTQLAAACVAGPRR